MRILSESMCNCPKVGVCVLWSRNTVSYSWSAVKRGVKWEMSLHRKFSPPPSPRGRLSETEVNKGC